MKRIILFLFFLVITSSLSQDISNTNKVKYDTDLGNGNVMYESDLNDKSYSYRSETADGQVQYQSGHFEDGSLVVEGGHDYIGEKGFKSSVAYIADKNGYRSKVAFGTKLVLIRPHAGVQTIPPPAPVTVYASERATTYRITSTTTPAVTRPTRYTTKPTKKPTNLAKDVKGSAVGGFVKRSPKIDERNIILLLNTFFNYLDNENRPKP